MRVSVSWHGAHVVNSYPACHPKRGFARPAWWPAPAHVSVEGCSPPSPVLAEGDTILENSSLPVTHAQKNDIFIHLFFSFVNVAEVFSGCQNVV